MASRAAAAPTTCFWLLQAEDCAACVLWLRPDHSHSCILFVCVHDFERTRSLRADRSGPHNASAHAASHSNPCLSSSVARSCVRAHTAHFRPDAQLTTLTVLLLFCGGRYQQLVHYKKKVAMGANAILYLTTICGLYTAAVVRFMSPPAPPPTATSRNTWRMYLCTLAVFSIIARPYTRHPCTTGDFRHQEAASSSTAVLRVCPFKGASNRDRDLATPSRNYPLSTAVAISCRACTHCVQHHPTLPLRCSLSLRLAPLSTMVQFVLADHSPFALHRCHARRSLWLIAGWSCETTESK